MQRLRNSLSNVTIQYEQRIDELIANILSKENYIVRIKKEGFRTILGKLEALSPLAVLKRGYSITLTAKDGKIVKDASNLAKSDVIKTKLAKGEVISKVEEVKE